MMEQRAKVSVIGGKKVRERAGKLSKDLGKPAMKATAVELKSYVDTASGAAEKKKRVARVNLMKAHKKGLKAKGSKVPKPKKGAVKIESINQRVMKLRPAVVLPKYKI